MKKLLLLPALLLALLAGCRIYDGPPKEPDTPEPSPHSGVFVSEYGTLTFPGDGESIVLDLDGELAAAMGLPEGKCEGSYQFMANTPPHIYEERYDQANELHLQIGGRTCRLLNSMGTTDENTLKLFVVTEEGSTIQLLFEKARD